MFPDMKNSIKLVLALVGVALMALSSCNTVAGFGRDIQGAGEAINKSADR
jgi:predicted small secreted protein